MIGHLGARVSSLLDGHLDPVETERAWNHVHECHQCRDLVEREGWVKRRLARLSDGSGGAPEHLKGSLLGAPGLPGLPGRPSGWAEAEHRPRRSIGAGAVAVGGGAVGAAMLGVLALGAAPAAAPTAPTMDQRAPLTQLTPLGPVLPSVTPALDRSGRGGR